MGVDRRSVAIGVLAVVAAAAVGVAAGAVAGGPRRTAGQATEPAGSAAPATPGPPTAISGDRSEAPKVPAPLPTGPAVPVYVLGGAGSGSRLYREFRPGGTGDAVTAAVRMLTEAPLDPDYRTPWLRVPVVAVTRSQPEVTVRFGAAPRLAGGGTLALAVQQVVHTVTAADTKVERVRVEGPGIPISLDRALPRAAPLDVLAPVWLLTPTDGARSGRRVRVTGTASVFEATVQVEARQGSRVVARGFATASVGAPGRGEWSTTLTLPPGDYVLAAYEESAKDGTPLHTDTKRLTITP